MKKLALVLALILCVQFMPAALATKPKCTNQQLINLNQLAIDFNNNRAYFLKYVVYANEANDGMVRTRRSGDVSNEASYRETFAIAVDNAKKTADLGRKIEGQIKTALAKCVSGYGVKYTSDYGMLQMTKSIKGVSFPAYFIPSIAVQPAVAPVVCSTAQCMPSTWGNNQSLSAVLGGPVRESANYESDLMVYCSKPGSGSIAVTDARIVMAFTASTSWRENYLSEPVENDFFRKDSVITDASSEMKYFDVPSNVARYDSTPLASEYKRIQFIPATALTRHICETNVPFIYDVEKRISPKVAGVGFFYLATLSGGRTIMVFLSGFDAQTFMTPRFTAFVSYSANQITYSGKAYGVVAVSGGRDPWNSTSGYFGGICFRIDGVEDKNLFPCKYFNSYWRDQETRNDFAGTLNVSSLSAGSHTLEMYVPTAPNKDIATQKFTFSISR